MRVEFDLRESLNALAPSSPIALKPRWSFVRVEFDLRESLNVEAPAESIPSWPSNGVNFQFGGISGE